MTGKLTIVDHPLVAHRLSLMRDKTTPPALFRSLLREISLLLGYEILRDLPTEQRGIETPVGPAEAPFLKGSAPVLVPILRAGDQARRVAVEYYCKLPSDITERRVILVDPMLAKGNSAVAAISRLKHRGARDIRLICLLAAPEGIAALNAAHPDVAILTAAVDRQLNEHGYIVPGLGDAGDRMYGTG